jgi:hypothetical protein
MRRTESRCKTSAMPWFKMITRQLCLLEVNFDFLMLKKKYSMAGNLHRRAKPIAAHYRLLSLYLHSYNTTVRKLKCQCF